jgi:hypothetical protein
MTLEDMQQAIAKLSAEDRAKLRLWLAEFEAAQAEREPETKASKLGALWRTSANAYARPSPIVSATRFGG